MVSFIDVRVFYTKRGRLKYISHLDINRCMQRAIVRAGLPAWHTEGFHPHLYTTFALPLSLGYESDCEIMDFRLTEACDFDQIKERLNAVLPEGLCVLRVAPRGEKFEKITAADYLVELHAYDAVELSRLFSLFLAQPSIEVEKKTKKGSRTVDLKQELIRCETELRSDCLLLKLTLPAGQKTVNPGLLVDTFAQAHPGVLRHAAYLRTAIWSGEGTEFA